MTFNDTASSITQYEADNTGGYIEQGETVILKFAFPDEVLESETVELMFMPDAGAPMPVTFTTPSVMVNQMVQLR